MNLVFLSGGDLGVGGAVEKGGGLLGVSDLDLHHPALLVASFVDKVGSAPMM